MRIKLDENIGTRGADILRSGGCDVATVVVEDLCSASDETLIEVSRAERRTLISFDKDFASILRFPPARYAGLVVLRLPEPITLHAVEDALRRFLAAGGWEGPFGPTLDSRLTSHP